MDGSALIQLQNEVREELTERLLPWWTARMVDSVRGGFFGRIDGRGVLHSDAEKGAVLNTRILWTFSAAARITGDRGYLAIARRAYEYLTDYFEDRTFGGIYWSLNADGTLLNSKKQTYAQGFYLYGLSEYYRATHFEEVLERAIALFRHIETYCKDPQHGGYFEAFTREWAPIEDMRLSDKDANEKKTMNTHLHVIEPYTNLYRIWPSAELAQAIRELISIFTDRILASNGHQNLFFSETWDCKSDIISYGHDIEASWLLWEAAAVLNDPELLSRITPVTLRVAQTAAEGLQTDGSMIYEARGGHADRDRHWWVQAETVVGAFYAWRNSGDDIWLQKSINCWHFIAKYIRDAERGEWFWSVDDSGYPNRIDDKAGFWKCPYHNARMCMEIMGFAKSGVSKS